MNPRLTSVQVLPNLHLSLKFNNGGNLVFGAGTYIKDIPALQRLTNPVYFSRAYVAHGTVAWSDDEDICPDTLHLAGTPAEQKAA